MKYARAKRAKILFFIVKYANLWGFGCRRRRGCLSSLSISTQHLINLALLFSCKIERDFVFFKLLNIVRLSFRAFWSPGERPEGHWDNRALTR